MDFTNKAIKPSATSVATNTSTPGAVLVDASSMIGKQAFQKTKDLPDGPSYYPEDHLLQQLPSILEEKAASYENRYIASWYYASSLSLSVECLCVKIFPWSELLSFLFSSCCWPQLPNGPSWPHSSSGSSFRHRLVCIYSRLGGQSPPSSPCAFDPLSQGAPIAYKSSIGQSCPRSCSGGRSAPAPFSRPEALCGCIPSPHNTALVVFLSSFLSRCLSPFWI